VGSMAVRNIVPSWVGCSGGAAASQRSGGRGNSPELPAAATDRRVRRVRRRRGRRIREPELHAACQKAGFKKPTVDEILDKINEFGIESLTPLEQSVLKSQE
jgi:hypothetical protein